MGIQVQATFTYRLRRRGFTCAPLVRIDEECHNITIIFFPHCLHFLFKSGNLLPGINRGVVIDRTLPFDFCSGGQSPGRYRFYPEKQCAKHEKQKT